MKNRVLGLMVAAAFMGMGPAAAFSRGLTRPPAAADIAGGDAQPSLSYRRRKGPGWRHRTVKRMKAKRNRLRAKGQHRKAVR